ncbi:MAG: lipopolysaccharide kinase InaA family protein [Planctomycetota bacterium]
MQSYADSHSPSRGGLVISEGFETLLRANGWTSLDALLSCSNGERLDKPGLDSWRQRWRLTLDDHGTPRMFYLKRFLGPPRWAIRAMRSSGGGASSLAGNEWEWIRRITEDGIPCVQAVAFGEDLACSHELRSAILTAGVPGQSLERWVIQWHDADRFTIQQLIMTTAALISRLHRQGYIHRDLYLSHVFYDPSSPMERSLRLIDLQRVIRPRWRFRRWMVKDLASLNFSTPSRLVSRTDRVRWLRRYLGIEKLDASARRLVYRVVGKTQRIAERERAKSHP